MALPSSRQQREYDKFIERADGQTAVATDSEAYQFSQTLISFTNAGAGTYVGYLDMAGAKYAGIQFEKFGGTDTTTLTLEATIQDDGTLAPGITTWQDVTAALTGSASFTADAMMFIDTVIACKYIKIQVVVAGGANDADFDVYAKITT